MKMFGECLSALWVPRPYGAYVPVCSGAPSRLHGWACVGPHPTVRAEPVEASDPDVGLAPSRASRGARRGGAVGWQRLEGAPALGPTETGASTAPDFPRAEAQDDMSCPLLPLTSHLLPLPLSSSATSPLDFRAASTTLKTEVRKCPELESASMCARKISDDLR